MSQKKQSVPEKVEDDQIKHIQSEIKKALDCLESVKTATEVVIKERDELKEKVAAEEAHSDELQEELDELQEKYNDVPDFHSIQSYDKILWSATNLIDRQVMETLAECLHIQNAGAHKLLKHLEKIRDDHRI